MNCPACNNELTILKAAGVSAQSCAGACGGLWFDRPALKKLEDRLPGAGEPLLHVERAEGVYTFRDVQHPCPKCTRTLLYRHCFSRKFQYEIDQCAKCGGFWVDAGALARLDPESPSDEDRQIAHAYFKSLFEDNLSLEHLSHPDTQEAARAVAQIYRFLTPTPLFPAEYHRK